MNRYSLLTEVEARNIKSVGMSQPFLKTVEKIDGYSIKLIFTGKIFGYLTLDDFNSNKYSIIGTYSVEIPEVEFGMFSLSGLIPMEDYTATSCQNKDTEVDYILF